MSDVMIGVSARPFSKSLALHIQQMGRVMRSHPDKEFGLWLDHSGNYLRFRDDWDDVFETACRSWTMAARSQKRNPARRRRRPPSAPSALHSGLRNYDTCPNCGHVRMRRNDVEAVPGYMEEPAGRQCSA